MTRWPGSPRLGDIQPHPEGPRLDAGAILTRRCFGSPCISAMERSARLESSPISTVAETEIGATLRLAHGGKYLPQLLRIECAERQFK